MGNIVCLASYPKSGNTWLRAFLANLVANRSAPVPLKELSAYAEDEANPDLFGELAGFRAPNSTSRRLLDCDRKCMS